MRRGGGGEFFLATLFARLLLLWFRATLAVQTRSFRVLLAVVSAGPPWVEMGLEGGGRGPRPPKKSPLPGFA